MPRFASLLLMAALAAAGYAATGDIGEDDTAASMEQGQVDSASGERGENHVEFSGAETWTDEARLSVQGSCGLGAHLVLERTTAVVDFCVGGDMGDKHVDFRIAIQPDGRVDVNGQEFAGCDPAEGCRLSLAWSSGTSTLVVQVEQADGSLAAGQFYIAEAPTEISVQAAEIRALSITPQ